jgi:glycosyltransferase involved in cell wall biosynthesis
MNFCIITHVEHIQQDKDYFGYAPYIKEMNIWIKYIDKLIVVAPIVNLLINPIHQNYIAKDIDFKQVSNFSITSFSNTVNTLVALPKIVYTIYKAMQQADHIHLRCPGNMGLLGSLVQILFPNKPKTAKYAGNWDPKSKQPLSYKIQKWILSNTFLTRNIQVLVYGEWKNQTINIKPFFTATYSETEKNEVKPREINNQTTLKFLFVGALSKGKQPLYVVQIVEELFKNGYKVNLELFGEGMERNTIQNYIQNNNLESFIFLRGNQSTDFIKQKYQESHFLILPSKSEGWPKAVAEAMFWGCVPISTSVSCVPNMLDYGKRGIILKNNLEKDYLEVLNVIKNQEIYNQMSNSAQDWSQKYTLEYFEEEIKKLIIK